MWLRINGSASAKGANTAVCEPRWPILITFEVAALAVVPRKITGPVIAVAPRSLITSRRRHNLLAEFWVLISVVCVTHSIYGLSLGKSPSAIQNLGAEPIEAHRINPALRDRQTIGSCTVAAAELDGHRAVFALLCGDVVNGIGVKLVGLEVALGVVDGDRPEGIDRHVLNL